MLFDEIWRLRRRKRKLQEAFKADRKKAASWKDEDVIREDERFEVGMVDDEIDSVLTRRLAAQALKLDIPFPRSEYKQSSSTGVSYIDTAARFTLAQEIRKERKERREYQFGIWKDIALLLTALAAVISSFIAIHKK